MSTMRVLALLVFCSALGAPARAADCESLDRGTEILHNIMKRYYQRDEDVKALVIRILSLVKKNVVEAKTIEDVNLPFIPGAGNCAQTRAGLRQLSTLMGSEITALDQALTACSVPILDTPDSEDVCHDKALAALRIDREIGRDEDGPTIAPQDGKLVRFMVTLGGTDCGHPVLLQAQARVHALVAPTWCGRFGPDDDQSYCYSTRIGKMREAREHLARVAGPPGAAAAVAQASPLLHAHKGDGACKRDMEDGGAEGNLWCLRDHPDYENGRLFDAVLEVTKAVRILKAANSSACGN